MGPVLAHAETFATCWGHQPLRDVVCLVQHCGAPNRLEIWHVSETVPEISLVRLRSRRSVDCDQACSIASESLVAPECVGRKVAAIFASDVGG